MIPQPLLIGMYITPTFKVVVTYQGCTCSAQMTESQMPRSHPRLTKLELCGCGPGTNSFIKLCKLAYRRYTNVRVYLLVEKHS